MGLAERDYGREEWQERGGPRGMSATAWVIVANVAVFVVQMLLTPAGSTPAFQEFGHFSTFTFFKLEVWRLLTFQFLHGGPMHLALNMFGLWVFGRLVEEHMGAKRYLAFYLVCGICGGLMYLLLNLGGLVAGRFSLIGVPGLLYGQAKGQLIGASAGVFGVIVAAAYLRPSERVQMIFPPVEISLKWMAYTYVGISVGSLLWGTQNAGGEAAHIGGAIAGFFFVRNSHLLRDFFDVFGDSRKPPKERGKSGATAGDKPAQRQGIFAKLGGGIGGGGEELSSEELDRLLEKISKHGMDSLSTAEKKKLQQNTENRRKASGM